MTEFNNKNACNHINYRHFCFVRMKGLEPLRLAAPDPKSGSATNYDTSAAGRKDSRFYLCQHFKCSRAPPAVQAAVRFIQLFAIRWHKPHSRQQRLFMHASGDVLHSYIANYCLLFRIAVYMTC